jgi:hypothetical protein
MLTEARLQHPRRLLHSDVSLTAPDCNFGDWSFND